MHKILNMHNWISELPQDIAQAVVQQFVTRGLVDGECLYNQGDEPGACYQVLSGRLKICNFSHNGQELVLSYLVAGDCVGDLGLIIDQPRINCAFACGDTRVGVLRRAQFHHLYEQYPEIPKALNRVMSRRLRHAFMLAEDAGLLPLRQRLARTLVRMAHSIGRVHADGSASVEDISHEELGKMVGSTRQAVSRELKKLEQEGSIDIQYGKIIIGDLAGFGEAFDQLLGVEPVVPDYGEQQ